ncbi:MAG: hypothetical protein ACRD12_20605 [Acidimicrobiales bacterium]
MRRTALAFILTLVPTLAWVTPASAATTGFTWSTDGAFETVGPPGVVVSAYATGAVPGAGYKLVAVPCPSDDMPCNGAPVEVNANVRRASSSGFISITRGPVNGPTGSTWQVFFAVLPLAPAYTQPPAYVHPSTYPVYIGLR